jgi:transposase
MEIMYEVSAGIDVHRDTVVVSIRTRDPRGKERVETRTFETFHDSLVEMRTWLDEHEVPIVGLESTGVYWKPVVRVLQLGAKGRVIWLVNPAEVKKVPGRKTDVKDSEWLSKLVMHGLVSPSVLPPLELEELRKLTRYRTRLVAEQTSYKNRVLKELESSGIKLATVCSDVFGKSGRAMLAALLEGSRTPAEIADLAHSSMHSKRATLERAVHGDFSAATRFVLTQMLRHLTQLQSELQALDEQIQQRLKAYQPEVELLKSVPGLDLVAIAGILAETGPDMSVFDGADRLAAWSGLVPGSNESAGKSKSAPTRKGDKYLRTMLVQAGWSAVRTRGTFWKQKFRQLVVRLGPKKAIVAIARKMLVAIFYILRDATPYREPEPAPPSMKSIRRLIERVEALGYQVTPRPTAAPAS